MIPSKPAMPKHHHPSDPRAPCPLCGAPNQCALASASPKTPCWCMAVVIAPETLAQIPAPLQQPACICQACAHLRTSVHACAHRNNLTPDLRKDPHDH